MLVYFIKSLSIITCEPSAIKNIADDIIFFFSLYKNFNYKKNTVLYKKAFTNPYSY